MSNLRTCPACGHDISRAHFRCPDCGQLLPSMISTPTKSDTITYRHVASSGHSSALAPSGTHTVASLLGNLLSSEGRSGRLEYFVSSMLVFGGGMLLIVVLGLLAVSIPGMALLGLGAMLIGLLVILVMSLIVGIRRLHDLDRSGWWILALLVPLLNVLVILALYFMPGTPGGNHYGASPAGKIMPTPYIWISVAIFVISLFLNLSGD